MNNAFTFCRQDLKIWWYWPKRFWVRGLSAAIHSGDIRINLYMPTLRKNEEWTEEVFYLLPVWRPQAAWCAVHHHRSAQKVKRIWWKVTHLIYAVLMLCFLCLRKEHPRGHFIILKTCIATRHCHLLPLPWQHSCSLLIPHRDLSRAQITVKSTD